MTAFLLNVPETTASSHTSYPGSRIVIVQASSSVSFKLVLHPHAGAVSDEYNKQSSGNRQKNGRSKLIDSRFATHPLPRNPSTRPGRYDRITSTKLSMIAGAYENYLPRVNRAISTPRSKYVAVIGARYDISAGSLNFRISKRTKSVPTRPSKTYQRQFKQMAIWGHQMTQIQPLMCFLWFIGNKRTNCCATTVETSLHIVLHMESSILRNHTGPTSSFSQGWLTVPHHDFRGSLRHC